MKTIWIVSDMVNDTPTTKAEMFRFSSLPLNSAVKDLETEKTKLIEYWKWFNSVEEAEQYLEKL